jgi:hypothetical protein
MKEFRIAVRMRTRYLQTTSQTRYDEQLSRCPYVSKILSVTGVVLKKQTQTYHYSFKSDCEFAMASGFSGFARLAGMGK